MLMTSEASETTWLWEIHLQFIGSSFGSGNCNVDNFLLIYSGFKIKYNLFAIYNMIKQMSKYISLCFPLVESAKHYQIRAQTNNFPIFIEIKKSPLSLIGYIIINLKFLNRSDKQSRHLLLVFWVVFSINFLIKSRHKHVGNYKRFNKKRRAHKVGLRRTQYPLGWILLPCLLGI